MDKNDQIFDHFCPRRIFLNFFVEVSSLATKFNFFVLFRFAVSVSCAKSGCPQAIPVLSAVRSPRSRAVQLCVINSHWS